MNLEKVGFSITSDSVEAAVDLEILEGDGNLGVFSVEEVDPNFEPHCSQKLLEGGFFAPHLLHTFASAMRKLLKRIEN